MYQKITQDFIKFSMDNPTCFHVVQDLSETLKKSGFKELHETDIWSIKPGENYFTTRNGSSLIAFKIPAKDITGCNIIAAHTDSPALKIKGTNAEIKDSSYIKLNVEFYGGLLMSTWFDRPLSLAGRVMVREKASGSSAKSSAAKGSNTRSYKMVEKLVNIDRNLVALPSVAIHMNRDANKGIEYNAQVDLLPLLGLAADGDASKLLNLLGKELKVDPKDIVDFDLFVYDRTPGTIWGADNEFFSVQHIDDLQCAYASFRGFLDATTAAKAGTKKKATSASSTNAKQTSMPLLALFDNEEVGSNTKQGADSTFLDDVLNRISDALGYSKQKTNAIIAGSMLISADNAHALHPNHPEHHDPVNRPIMNKGIVIKHAANQHYTTDSVSAALFHELCRMADVPTQEFYNRSDRPGGGTLGNISNSHVSLNSVDIGLPQLAMHSCYETAGVHDTAYLAKVANLFFSTTLVVDQKTGSYEFR